ncbi:helix-turn-helix protein [Rubripirellula tenax]|uniref:Helix-turn-helix protein n=1 Tax=Rubripirellula tenax TaxID=2528015 RepID=A0A5C6EIH9_9BACT|nr:helix-turn-helix transcriptional regulator [Rubripirellula tenax]TWU48862.1 helix-turn-helix protein [Rubripirellula tenax]
MPRKPEPNLTNCVRELRGKTEGMTQQSLADAVSVTRQTIVAMETGTYTPPLALAIRIARVFDCGVEDVFTLQE